MTLNKLRHPVKPNLFKIEPPSPPSAGILFLPRFVGGETKYPTLLRRKRFPYHLRSFTSIDLTLKLCKHFCVLLTHVLTNAWTGPWLAIEHLFAFVAVDQLRVWRRPLRLSSWHLIARSYSTNNISKVKLSNLHTPQRPEETRQLTPTNIDTVAVS